jgi:hypothetical protein
MIKFAGFSGLVLLFGTALNAASVTYSYTGDDFTTYSGTYTSGVETNLTISLTFASALGDNFHETQVTPQSFQISDGSTTLTDQSSNIDNAGTFFDIGTDAAGDVDEWDVEVDQTNDAGYLQLLGEVSVDYSADCGPGSVPAESCNAVGSASVEYSDNQPGWTSSAAAPEPSTLVLAVMGALCVLAGSRRKSKSDLSR